MDLDKAAQTIGCFGSFADLERACRSGYIPTIRRDRHSDDLPTRRAKELVDRELRARGYRVFDGHHYAGPNPAPLARTALQPSQERPTPMPPSAHALDIKTAPKTETKTKTEVRTYLAVPYRDRLTAKQAGARWDPERKAWYAPQVTDALQRWLPTALSLPPKFAEVDPRTEFTAVMQRTGLTVPEGHPIPDGVRHRVPTADDKRGRKSGFYLLHVDGVPNGVALNHQTGEVARWTAKVKLSEEEKATLRAQAATQADQRTRALSQQHAQVALQCREELQCSTTLQYGDATPYLLDKGVVAHRGLYASIDGKTTHVPLLDVDGQLWSMQTIDPKGQKRFAEGGRVKGCFHALGGMKRLQQAAEQGVVVLAEGYATAASIADILDGAPAPVSTVATLFAHNLQPVAESLRARYPNATLIIAGDDDRARKTNAGRHHATEAARAVGATVTFPPFTAEHPKKLSDWNDIDRYQLKGYDSAHHRAHLRQAVARELSRPRSTRRPPPEGESDGPRPTPERSGGRSGRRR